jgi:hypothetical protein
VANTLAWATAECEALPSSTFIVWATDFPEFKISALQKLGQGFSGWLKEAPAAT